MSVETLTGGALVAAATASIVLAGLRWLRVAQREHYGPGMVTRFAARWWGPWLPAVGAVAIAVDRIVTPDFWAAAFLVPLGAALGPRGLTLRGRTSELAWTRRLRTLAVVAGFIAGAAIGIGAALGEAPLAAVAVALGVPLVVDLALAATGPVERRAADRFVADARDRLRQVDPVVVAITGSYGKTTTKGYVRHLLTGSRAVLASPASFNNRAGLSRAVNEHLTPGTEVFVAEMGTYGPGEIAELCRWVRPRVSAITAIGPVHLERFGTVERIVEAKSEILEGVEVAVLNIDAPHLADVADRTEAAGTRVVRCSTSDTDADVLVTSVDGKLAVEVYGSPLATVELPSAHPSNVACALGIALALGVEMPDVVGRLSGLPAAEHRQQVATAPSGVTVIDDTYNANPAGAAAALDLLRHHARPGHRAVVVTPGMIELGPLQAEENRRFAAAAARLATHLLVVGRTNRKALLAGAEESRAGSGDAATVLSFGVRQEAVAWVRANLGPGDTVLYENDLPDHYP